MTVLSALMVAWLDGVLVIAEKMAQLSETMAQLSETISEQWWS